MGTDERPGELMPVARTVVDWSTIPDFDPLRITRFRHHLDDEPLLRLTSLHDLANRVSLLGDVHFKSPSIASVADHFLTANEHAEGLTIDEVFARVEEPATWLAIYRMSRDDAYRGFCDELLAEVDHHVGVHDPGMYGPDLAIFLSSPPAFTPYHIDQHPVFFFQVRGRKRLCLWDRADPEVLRPETIEKFLCWKTEGLVRYDEDVQAKAYEFELAPGDGVYWPATTPHLALTEAQPRSSPDRFSLSFNISYYTDETRRHLCVAALNEFIRDHSSIRPTPYGASRIVDVAKYPLGRAFLGLRRLLRGAPMRPEQGL